MQHRRIFVDVDGVLADFTGRFLRNYNARNGTSLVHDDVTDWDYSKVDAFKLRDSQEWESYLDPEFWLELDPLPWAHDLMAVIECMGIPFAFLTSLPNGSALEDRRKWLDRHFRGKDTQFNYPLHPSKRLIEAAQKDLVVGPGDLLIEDSIANVLAARLVGAEAILLAQPWNAGAAGRMTPSEILAYLRWQKA